MESTRKRERSKMVDAEGRRRRRLSHRDVDRENTGLPAHAQRGILDYVSGDDPRTGEDGGNKIRKGSDSAPVLLLSDGEGCHYLLQDTKTYPCADCPGGKNYAECVRLRSGSVKK